MPRARKHHNNKGPRQIKNGTILKPLQRAAAKLGVALYVGRDAVNPLVPPLSSAPAPKRKLN